MKLYEGKEIKLLVGDIETLACCIDFGFYDPDTEKWYEFVISKYRNDLFSFVKFYTSGKYEYVCGYNYISFDAQVIQFIINEHQKWVEDDNLTIVRRIYTFVQNLIDDQKYHLFLKYREHEFSIPVLDMFTMFGLNNEARMSSLKKIEFNINWHSVEEMPIHHSREDLTEEEILIVQNYRKNDVLATFELLKIAIGDTTLPIYKGNNQLEFRFDIMEEYDVPCLSWSDIKIGDELIKASYAKAIGVPVYKLPRKGTFRKEIHLKYCIPKYVQFKTKQLNELLKDVRELTLPAQEGFEREFKFYGTDYIMALGGLHSVNRHERYVADGEKKLRDWDVQSFYPRIIVNNSYFPYHLGKELLIVYKDLYDKRIELKPLAKTNKKIKGIVEALKLQMNIVFGKLGSMESWLYDKQTLLSVTLTGQFSLLMLIEMLELEGIHVFSANTDGITFQSDKTEIINDVWNKWQAITNFQLEETRYNNITYLTVNDYIAEKEDGEIKKKGDFITDHELWKNKSARVVPLALQEYFTKGTDPKEFINNYNEIYDYCIMAKTNGNMHLEEQEQESITKHSKLVRYYLSASSRSQLFKRGTGTKDQEMNNILNKANDVGKIYVQYFNKFEHKEDYEIDRDQYVYRCYKLIDRIEGSKRMKKLAHQVRNSNQLTLF